MNAPLVCSCARKDSDHPYTYLCDEWEAEQGNDYSEDNRLDSPQHGQADAINRENRSER